MPTTKMPHRKRIFYRIFPTEKSEFEHIKLDQTCNKIFVRHLQDLSKNSMATEPSYWEFDCDRIFFNSNQEDVYNEVEDGEVLKSVINGYNAIILTYGQTGTGKTFTASGLQLSEEEFGILPRLAKHIFEVAQEEPPNIKISLQMSYVEFYNTYAIDLLKSSPETIETYKCRDVRRVNIFNYFEALKCIFIGEGRKNFAEQCKFPSNLGTSVATFHVTTKNMDLTNPTKICSRLHLIDLAGNDSSTATTRSCKNPKQIGLANVTKSQMEQFVLCLKENIPENIRLRERTNALTYYLNGDFSNESILRLIGHIKLKTEDILITLSVLRFGSTIRGLKMKKRVIHFDTNEEMELAYLKSKLAAIEREKHFNSVLLDQDLVTGLNCERLAHLSNLVREYLSDEVQEITVMNVADTKTVLQNIKKWYKEREEEARKLQAENEALQTQRQHSEISLKLKGSKTSNSQGSVSKLSRRSSSKGGSKESISRSKRASGSYISEKRVKSLTDDVGATEIETSMASQKRKKSTKSSTSGFKSAQSKRRSSNTSVEKRDSKSSLEAVQMPVPDIVPEKQEIWRRFGSGGIYKERLEEYKKNEKEIKTTFASYVREVKMMHSYKDAVDKCSTDLLLAQTFRKFNSKDEYDKDGCLILSYAEKTCTEQLEDAKFRLIEQQERALTAQEYLKALLENRKNIVKRTEEEFDQFCLDNYRLPSADVELVQNDVNLYTYDANLDQSLQGVEQEKEITLLPEVPTLTQIIRGLQKLMMRERVKRKKIISQRSKGWKNV